MKGISTMLYCTQNAACIKEAGYDFVFRYYSVHTRFAEKIVTLDEIKAIRAAGLQLAICYEYGGDHLKYFNHSAGKRDGHYAYYFAQQMHQPADAAIYFAVDYAATEADIPGVIQDYFNGVLEGFNSFSNDRPIYRIGVYGPGTVCSWLRTHLPFVRYSWLAMPANWPGHDTYKDWDVKQFKSTEDLCGFKTFRPHLDADYEMNETKSDEFGQFTPVID